MAKKETAQRLCALPLGGLGEIGMNLMVYECDGEILIVDCGICFPGEMEAPGADVVLPDTKYLRENAKKIKGVCITHAHEDHIGALPYLWEELNDCPVYLSPFARLVLEDKLGQVGLKDGGRIQTALHGQQYEVGKFKVEFINITHSIPEANAVAITTQYGTLVHTGDYKFDPKPVLGEPTDEKRLTELSKQGVLAMLGDSTGALSDKDIPSESELLIAYDQILKQAKQKVIFTAFASNTGRLLKMIELAASNGRRICLLGRTAEKMLGHVKKLGYFPGSLTNHIVGPEEAAGFPPEQVLVIASGTQGESQASLTRLSQGANIKGVKINKGDTVILSSRMIPGNERAILDVQNKLIALGADVLTDYNHPKDMGHIHTSGHGSRKDMGKMYDLLKPQIVVPVHGEESQLVAQAKFAREQGIKHVISLRNGRKVVLAEQGADKNFKPYVMENTFPAGRNYVDGYNILDEDIWILNDRKQIAYNGLVTVALAMNSESKELTGDISLTTKGLVDPQLQKELIKDVTEKTRLAVNAVYADGIVDDVSKLYAVVQKTVRHGFNSERGKKPAVVTQIVEV